MINVTLRREKRNWNFDEGVLIYIYKSLNVTRKI